MKNRIKNIISIILMANILGANIFGNFVYKVFALALCACWVIYETPNLQWPE